MADENQNINNLQQNHIILKVLGHDNAMVLFKIKRYTPLKKVMMAYCARTGLSLDTVRFRFDGIAISEIDTAASLEMTEGSTIEVFYQQIGGYFLKPYYF